MDLLTNSEVEEATERSLETKTKTGMDVVMNITDHEAVQSLQNQMESDLYSDCL